EVPGRLGDRFVLRLTQRLLEALRQRVAAVLFRGEGLLEERLAAGGLFGEDLVRVVELRTVRGRRLDVANHALQIRVDHERGRTARTRDFEFRRDLRHDSPLLRYFFSSQSIATG